MPTLESKFKKAFLDELRDSFPGCVVITGNSATQQGIPDTLILFNDRWAALEFKRTPSASRQPNQSYFIEKFGEMSYASFVYPENKEEVFDAIRETFRA